MWSPGNGSAPPQVNASLVVSDINWYLTVAFISTNMLVIVPLSVLVLYLGHQRWRSGSAATSHSDFFSYNMAAMELIGGVGYALQWYEKVAGYPMVGKDWGFFVFFPWGGQMLFPLVTCVDRYLAVVHPVTYLALRRGRGVRIRVAAAASIWAQCFGMFAVIVLFHRYIFLLGIVYALVSLIVLIFCSLAVLLVLIQPRPGMAAGGRGRVDRAKQRAFYTICAVMGVLLLRFGGSLFSCVLGTEVGSEMPYWVQTSVQWISFPSSLVLPLIYLQRAGKLPGC